MNRIRFSKVRVTDHRPPPAGGKPPLERPTATRGGSMTGLDHLAAKQAREAAEHDSNIRNYTPEMVAAAYEDLNRRSLIDRPGQTWEQAQEKQWGRSRLAALLRLGSSMRERGLA